MYKLLALDIDDTTLNSKNQLTPAVKAQIKRAEEHGVQVVVATGRSYRGARKFLDELGVNGRCIAFGGAAIVEHPSGRICHANTLRADIVRQVIAFAKEVGVYIQVFDGRDYYYESASRYADLYAAANGFEGVCGPFDELAFDCAFKCLVRDDVRIPELYPLAVERFGDVCSIAVSKPFFLEFNQFGITKSHALDALASELGIARQEIIAVGDSLIDLDMIRYAGVGVAVANAPENIRAAADYVCPSNDEEGVAHVIKKFIFVEEA